MIRLDEDGNYISQEDFITGWLENENAWGTGTAFCNERWLNACF